MKKFNQVVWVIWYKDHIHTSIYGHLKVFKTRRQALEWKKEHGKWSPSCAARKMKITND